MLPILNIYRKYYGIKMAGFLLVTFYVTMVAAGYAVEIIFGVLGITPTERNATVLEPSISLNSEQAKEAPPCLEYIVVLGYVE